MRLRLIAVRHARRRKLERTAIRIGNGYGEYAQLAFAALLVGGHGRAHGRGARVLAREPADERDGGGVSGARVHGHGIDPCAAGGEADVEQVRGMQRLREQHDERGHRGTAYDVVWVGHRCVPESAFVITPIMPHIRAAAHRLDSRTIALHALGG